MNMVPYRRFFSALLSGNTESGLRASSKKKSNWCVLPSKYYVGDPTRIFNRQHLSSSLLEISQSTASCGFCVEKWHPREIECLWFIGSCVFAEYPTLTQSLTRALTDILRTPNRGRDIHKKCSSQPRYDDCLLLQVFLNSLEKFNFPRHFSKNPKPFNSISTWKFTDQTHNLVDSPRPVVARRQGRATCENSNFETTLCFWQGRTRLGSGRFTSYAMRLIARLYYSLLSNPTSMIRFTVETIMKFWHIRYSSKIVYCK